MIRRSFEHDILMGTPSYTNGDTSENWVFRHGPQRYYYKSYKALARVEEILHRMKYAFGRADISDRVKAYQAKYVMKKLQIIWKGYLELGSRWPYSEEDWKRWIKTGKAVCHDGNIYDKYYNKHKVLCRMHNAAQALLKLPSNPSMRFFEYHCDESESSSDYHLYKRTHSVVQIIAIVEMGIGSTPEERGREGCPRVYRIRFRDGFEADAFEDELLDSKDKYERPGFSG